MWLSLSGPMQHTGHQKSWYGFPFDAFGWPVRPLLVCPLPQMVQCHVGFFLFKEESLHFACAGCTCHSSSNYPSKKERLWCSLNLLCVVDYGLAKRIGLCQLCLLFCPKGSIQIVGILRPTNQRVACIKIFSGMQK